MTLDGTIIHKAGLITGGQSDQLLASSQRWEEKEVDGLHKLKDRLEKELAELSQARRKLHADEALVTEVHGLESRKAIMNDDLSATARKLASIQTELDHVDKELAEWTEQQRTATKTVSVMEQQSAQLEMTVHRAEDTAFKALCKALKIANIREYEGDQLKATQEAAEKRLQFATQKSRLENE